MFEAMIDVPPPAPFLSSKRLPGCRFRHWDNFNFVVSRPMFLKLGSAEPHGSAKGC